MSVDMPVNKIRIVIWITLLCPAIPIPACHQAELFLSLSK